jgi:hypothetical protein
MKEIYVKVININQEEVLLKVKSIMIENSSGFMNIYTPNDIVSVELDTVLQKK